MDLNHFNIYMNYIFKHLKIGHLYKNFISLNLYKIKQLFK